MRTSNPATRTDAPRETAPPGHGAFFVELRRRRRQVRQNALWLLMAWPATVGLTMAIRQSWMIPIVLAVVPGGCVLLAYSYFRWFCVRCSACGERFHIRHRAWLPFNRRSESFPDDSEAGMTAQLLSRCCHCGLAEAAAPWAGR